MFFFILWEGCGAYFALISNELTGEQPSMHQLMFFRDFRFYSGAYVTLQPNIHHQLPVKVSIQHQEGQRRCFSSLCPGLFIPRDNRGGAFLAIME